MYTCGKVRSWLLLTILQIVLCFLLFTVEIQLAPAPTTPSHILLATPTLSTLELSNMNDCNDGIDAAYSLLVILVLLLRAGLESNPGPVTGAGRWEGYSNNPPPQAINPVGKPCLSYQPLEDEKQDFKRIQEEFKAEQMEAASLLIQTWWRMIRQRRMFTEEKKSIIKCQAVVRRYTARSCYLSIRRGALTIQQRYRMKKERQQYLAKKKGAAQKLNAALLLQCWSRMILQKRSYQADLSKIIKCQAVVRQVQQRRRFLQMIATTTGIEEITLQKEEREPDEREPRSNEKKVLAERDPGTRDRWTARSPTPPMTKKSNKKPPFFSPSRAKTLPKKSDHKPPYLSPHLKATVRQLVLGLCGGGGTSAEENQESVHQQDRQMRRDQNERRFNKFLEKATREQVVMALPIDRREFGQSDPVATLTQLFFDSTLKEQEAILETLMSENNSTTQTAGPSTALVVPTIENRLQTPFLCHEPHLQSTIGMTNSRNKCFVIAAFNLLTSAPQFLQALQPVNEDQYRDNARLVPLLRRIVEKKEDLQDAAQELCKLVADYDRNVNKQKGNKFDDGRQKDLHDFLICLLGMMESEVKDASLLFGELFGLRAISTWTCNANPNCPVDTLADLHTENSLSLNVSLDTTTVEGAVAAEMRTKDLIRECTGCKSQDSKLTKSFATLPQLIPIHLKRYTYTDKINNRIEPMTTWHFQKSTFFLTGAAIHRSAIHSVGHYVTAHVIHLSQDRLQLKLVDDNKVSIIKDAAEIKRLLDSAYVLMYSKTLQETATQQLAAAKRRSQANAEEEEDAKKPKVADPEEGEQPKENPAYNTHPLVDFLHKLSARLPVPATTPSVDSLKMKDFKELCPLLGLTYSKNKSVKTMHTAVSGLLFDAIISALGPLKSVPLQGAGVTPNKNKSQHIGQLRQAFKDGTNKVQSKIFNDLLLVSENPLPQFSTEHPQEKVYPDQEPFQQKEDIKLRKGSSPSAPDPPVGQQEKVHPKQSDSEPVSTDSSMFCTLYIHLFPGIKSQRLWCKR